MGGRGKCGKSWLSEALMEPWVVQFVCEPISLSSNPWIPEPVIKLAAPWGACLYPQTGPSPPAPRSTLAPQMGIDGRGGAPWACCSPARHLTGLRRVGEGRSRETAQGWQPLTRGREPQSGLLPAVGGAVQLVRFLFWGPGTAQQRGW